MGGGRFKVLKRQLRPSFIKVIKLRVLAKNPHNMVTLAGNMYLFPSRIFTFLTYHIYKVYHASIQLGGGSVVLTTLENLKVIGFLENTGLDPLQNHKAAQPAFNVGPSSALRRNAI